MYGYCPVCGDAGKQRERRLNGNDKCANGHVYASKDSVQTVYKVYCKNGPLDGKVIEYSSLREVPTSIYTCVPREAAVIAGNFDPKSTIPKVRYSVHCSVFPEIFYAYLEK